MMFDLFFRRWAWVSLGLVFGVVGYSQAFGQSNVESFIRKVDGLKLFLKADEGVTTEDHSAKGGPSNVVKAWADQSGQNNHLARAYANPATWPEWLGDASGFGGRPVLKFGGKGSSNFSVTQGLIGQVNPAFNLNEGTIFLVGRWNHVTAISPLTLGPNAGFKNGRGGVGIRRGGDGKGWFAVHNGGNGSAEKLQTSEPLADDKPHLFTAVFDKRKGIIRMYLDGKDQRVQANASSTLPLDPVRFVQVGGHGLLDAPGEPGAEWFFGGEIAEILVFNRMLTSDGSDEFEDNEFNAVGWYLDNKYGLNGGFKEPILPVDSDGDGLTDGIEKRYAFLNPNRPEDAARDFDGDGLTNGQEYALKTLLDKADSDGDGLLDGAEVNQFKTSPLKRDTDGDGLKDAEEIQQTRTNPRLADTDGDGLPDGYELLEGTNPNEPKSRLKSFIDIRDEEVRVGTLAVAMDGTVLLVKDDGEKREVLVKRSRDGGKTWGPEIVAGKTVKIGHDMSDDGRYRGPTVGWSEAGNVLVDEINGDIMIFASSLMPAPILYRSKDHGKTWRTEKITIQPDKNGWLSATLLSCDPGVTLRYGKKKGRLLLPTRVFVGYLNKGKGKKHFNDHYSNSIYSDDGGKTWIPSAPFPLGGTGEAGLVELSDGSIYYNSRTHSRPGNRRIAHSYDHGETWINEHEDDELFDGPPDVYGCKAGLLRLPYEGRDILLYSAPGPGPNRENITVRVSFNGGKTWPAKRLVRPGPGNYTWLAAGRKGTPSEGQIYLLSGKDWLARFNLAWVMETRK